MSGGDLRASVIGFAGGIALLAILLSVVGVDRVLSTVAQADRLIVAAVVLIVLGWLTTWGLALHTVLGNLGIRLSMSRSVFVFAGAMFANNVTPFGQAGGEPVTAALISRVVDTEYENGLAAIASVDTLNFAPAITLSLVGVGYYATTVTVGRNFELAAVAVVALAAAVPTLLYHGWKHRYELERRLIGALTPLIRRVADALPRLSPPPTETVEERIEGFFAAVERIATDRRTLALALAFSTIGWILHAAALWTSFYSLGYAVPPAAVLLAVPIGAMAGITPLPGGLGGIESVLVLLLAPLTGIATAEVTAAVVIYRGAIYWLPTLIGGVTMGVFWVRE